MHLLDFLGAAFGIADTVLLIRCSIWAWPVGILAILLNTLLYWHSLLFADMCLQSLYLALYIYGWVYWQHENHQQKKIDQLSFKQVSRLLLYAVIFILLIHSLLSQFTPSTTPWFDATTTVLAIVAQWLTCKRVLQNWLLWFVNDTLYSILYAYKQLPFHVAEHLFYLSLAVIGYYAWTKKKRNASTADLNASYA